jgi:hypothetical protein
MAELIINSELLPGDIIKVDYDKEADKVVTAVIPGKNLLDETTTKAEDKAADDSADAKDAAPEANADAPDSKLTD